MQTRKATYVEKTPNDVYNDVAAASNLTPGEVASIGGVESQHGEFDRPIKGGSARGLFQFQPATAEYLEPGSSDSIHDMNTQADLMKKLLEKNNTESVEDAYVKHNLGSGRGSKFIQAKDSDSIESVLPARIINANPGLYKVKTVGEARAKIKQKLQKGEESNKSHPSFLDIFKGK